jgi:hypothetical protein
MRKLFSVLTLVLLYVTIGFGQAAVDIPLSGTDGTTTIPLAVGLDLTAENCIDPDLGESDLPPFPPAGVFDIRFDLNPYGCPNLSTAKDYRNAAAFPFTGAVEHTLWWQTSATGLPIEIQYNLPVGASMTIDGLAPGFGLPIGPFTGSGTAIIPGSYTAIFPRAFVDMDYTNIGGIAEPGFGIAPPAPLAFGNVEVGASEMLQTTVTNTGTADLLISNVVSSDAQFTFAPNVFPITILPGANQVFDVTFAPAAIGSYTADLTFTHNATGSPTVYALSGNGTAPGLVDLESTFSASDGSMDGPGNITAIFLAAGLDASATECIDPALGESDLPPFPPAGVFDIRFDLNPYGCPNLSSLKDYRFAADPSNFVGTVEHTLWWQVSATGLPIELQYNLHPNATMTINGLAPGFGLPIGPFTGSGTAIIPGSYTAIFPRAIVVIEYSPGVVNVPIFNVAPASLDFGNVNQGTTKDLNVTVSNTGNANLVISSAAIAAPEFTVAPNSATIIPGESQVFTVTFSAPATVGTYTGTLVFTDNAAGSPHSVPLTGNSIVPPPVFGLVFENEIVYRVEDNAYMDVMQLIATPFPIHAIQFRLYTNQELDDATILSFLSIQKGADVASSDWVLDYNVFRGPITGNGASKDVIYVLLYNTTEVELPAGDYLDLLHVNYRVANLPALQDSVKSSFVIKNAEGSTFEGFDVDITPSRDELQVIALNTKSGLGDVNGDGCIDILDLIMVVDHIVGRDSLSASEFARADIAPWVPGNELPDPDGFVNVQDLSLIQNIILTGFYPDGTPVAPCSYAILPKIEGDADAELNVYINNEGITVTLDSKVGIRGAQLEFNNVSDDAGNLVINTDLGQGYYLQVGEILRTLMYDRLAVKYIEAGEHFMADMPFVITNPEEITLDKLVLVDINTQRVMKIEVNLIYGSSPTLPLDYILFQNYPNPFNPSTTVNFQVPKTSDVTIKIYDMLGQEVRTLFAGEVLRGTYTVNWDGLNDAGQQMSSGSYIYRMISGEFMQAKKMVFVK